MARDEIEDAYIEWCRAWKTEHEPILAAVLRGDLSWSEAGFRAGAEWALRRAEIREALEFYANGWGYMDGNKDMTAKAKKGPCREWEEAREHIPVMRDFGEKARAALLALASLSSPPRPETKRGES